MNNWKFGILYTEKPNTQSIIHACGAYRYIRRMFLKNSEILIRKYIIRAFSVLLPLRKIIFSPKIFLATTLISRKCNRIQIPYSSHLKAPRQTGVLTKGMRYRISEASGRKWRVRTERIRQTLCRSEPNGSLKKANSKCFCIAYCFSWA